MMFSKALKRIPFDRVVPFNENDLLFIASQEVRFVLKNIMNEDDEYFSIKHTMTQENEKGAIFACKDFEATCAVFAEKMGARIERFFETGKSSYIFFDQEEQMILEEAFTKNNLSCLVDIYMIGESGKFQKISFEEMKYSSYKNVRKFMNELGIVYVIKPDRYMNLLHNAKSKTEGQQQKRSKFNLREISARHERDKINKILLKYPEFNAATQNGIKAGFRILSIKLHPDSNAGNDAGFNNMKDSYTYLKKTSWYKNLPEKEAKGSD